MANNKARRNLHYSNSVQDVEVPGVRAKRAGARKNEDGVRYLNAKRIMAHHAHISQMGKTYSRGCAMCTGGLSAVYTVVESKVPEVELVEDPGVDEEGNDPFSLSDGGPGRKR